MTVKRCKRCLKRISDGDHCRDCKVRRDQPDYGPGDLLSVREVCEIIPVSERTVRDPFRRDGIGLHVQPVRVGARVFFRAAEIQEFLKSL